MEIFVGVHSCPVSGSKRGLGVHGANCLVGYGNTYHFRFAACF